MRRLVRYPLCTLVITAIAFVVVPASVAVAAGYVPGFYSGSTSQKKPIVFLVAGGEVSALGTEIVDSCHPGSYLVSLTPHPAQIRASGDWSHRADEIPAQPAVYHGHVSGTTANGTIDDIIDNARGQRCHGHVTFHATRKSPVRIASATVGGLGTEIQLSLTMPAAYYDGQLVPDTLTALLVYASNSGCPETYQAADALARSESSDGYTGLISDANVITDYDLAESRSYSHGVFTFDVSANTIIPTATGQSSFATVCAMLYSGTPASLTPSQNLALETTHAPLVPGPGIPGNQP